MTMQEINPGPLGALALHVMGGARAPWGAAWRYMAGVTGIDVAAGTRRAPPPELPRVAFVCDPRGPRCSDGQPALRVVRGEDGQAVSLAERQVINHRFVVQALLTHTIS